MYNENLRKPKALRKSLRGLAQGLGLASSTLQREIHRGIVGTPMIHHDKEYWEYSAWKAQGDVDEGAKNKGAPMLFINTTAALLKMKIKDEGKSPNHARMELLAQGLRYVPSLSAIYYRIDHGDIGILHGETPYRPKRKRKRKEPLHKAWKMPGNLSIEERPDISDRAIFDHWEMDTVVSGISGKGGLLVLVERKTRLYLIVRLGRITQAAVLHAIKTLIRSGIMKKVLSITTDNGCEFLDSQQIKGLFAKINAEVKGYYTHAYAAWEKGSVENANRHVRRFYPKGSDFSRLTHKQVKALEDFINSIPRTTSLKGKTAHEAFLAAA